MERNMNKIDLTDKELLSFIGKQESQEIGGFDSYGDRLEHHMSHGYGLVGDKLPWSKTHSAVRLGEGQMSIWSGINGHGKTLMLSMVCTHLMARGRRVLVASMEMKPEETLLWMCTQAAGCKPSKEFAHSWVERNKDSFIYDCLDKVPQERILGLVHYAGSELDIDHLVIDSLTMCGVGREDYSQQAEFVNQLRAAAKMHKLHIHLVCHMRKGSDENEQVGKFSIRGAGEIADLADKVFVVFRNKQREQHLAYKENKIPFDEKFINQPDVWLKLVKNRQDGTELNFGLYFHKDSMQFTSIEGRPMPLEGNTDDM
tara:strand:- start:4411 stop:5352 length:942 start_codon:yes stop_codon:yes gene_type:complete